jgi:hypothetical protein
VDGHTITFERWRNRWIDSNVIRQARQHFDRAVRRTAAKIKALSDADALDACAIMNAAAEELNSSGFKPYQHVEKAYVQAWTAKLPAFDFEVLQHFQGGRTHKEIAVLMNTDPDIVRRSVVRTYTDLRLAMIGAQFPGGDGDGEPVPAPPITRASLPKETYLDRIANG